jgi:hypothetical protein
MIHYALRCGDGHEFDGWFKSSASFDCQAESGMLDCPVCADTRISRALMAPRLGGKNRTAPEKAPGTEKTQIAEVPEQTILPPAPAELREVAVMPDQVRAVLQRLRTEVEKRCDYVGDQFASEARRIHRGITAERPIYGEATPEDAEALAEDGIEVGRLPWVPRADS